MRNRYFEIGDNDWGLLLCWDYNDEELYDDVYSILYNFGMDSKGIRRALGILGSPDSGMTVSDFSERMSVILIGDTTSEEQWIDTLMHELKHVVEHISSFYKVSPKSEDAAYLQGEIGRQLFPVILSRLCSNRNTVREL